MAKIGVRGSCGHNQVIVGQTQVVQQHEPFLQIKAFDFTQQDLSIGGVTQHGTHGRGNFSG